MQCNHSEQTTASKVKWYAITYVNTFKYWNHLAPKGIYFNIYMGLVLLIFLIELSPLCQLHEKL